MTCRYGYTEVPDQGHDFVEMVLLTVLNKLYKELHSVVQNSEELSLRYPALAKTDPGLIAASAVPAGNEPGVTIVGPVPGEPSVAGLKDPTTVNAPTSPIKALINKSLQMTSELLQCTACSSAHADPEVNSRTHNTFEALLLS